MLSIEELVKLTALTEAIAKPNAVYLRKSLQNILIKIEIET
jgi:hypothetical protein